MHDRDYCSQRAAKERAAAFHRGCEDAEISGHLALAYASLAKRLAAKRAEDSPLERTQSDLLVEE